MSKPLYSPDFARDTNETKKRITNLELANYEDATSSAETWHRVGNTGEPIFQNTWGNYTTSDPSPAAFYKDSDGFVHIRGLVRKNGGAGSWVAGDIIFTLPSGYRPPGQVQFLCNSNSGAWELQIDPNGNVHVGNYGGSSNPITYASISGAYFKTD